MSGSGFSPVPWGDIKGPADIISCKNAVKMHGTLKNASKINILELGGQICMLFTVLALCLHVFGLIGRRSGMQILSLFTSFPPCLLVSGVRA